MSFRFLVYSAHKFILLSCLLVLLNYQFVSAEKTWNNTASSGRSRTSLNTGWRFWHSTTFIPDHFVYDNRPDTINRTDVEVLKSWILPSGNDFILDPANRHERPAGNPGSDLSFVQSSFNDSTWESVTLPHDWAIGGPFYDGTDPIVGGGMGRLPVQGIAWYRRILNLADSDEGKSIYLEIDGAQSYAMVWLNGNLVGGWPYPYNSFRLDLTPYVQIRSNQLAIRLDNPNASSRWYPGGGLYRNVWLTKVEQAHVAQWGTYVTTSEVSAKSTTVNLVIQVENSGAVDKQVEVSTDVHIFDSTTGLPGIKVAEFSTVPLSLAAGQKLSVDSSVVVNNPRLWGPPPTQQPNLYVAVIRLLSGNETEAIDTYETTFGIRTITYDANHGLLVNGEAIPLQGVNQHQDMGALGAAFNVRAAERQLEILRDMGCNAIRLAHNPPAPELLDLTDRMGFLIIDEIFDCWELGKTTNDFHLIFDDWHEPDARSYIRRDRNHPSVIIWSFGNEVGEQTLTNGSVIALKLHEIVREEDPTRQTMASMNVAKPNMTFPTALDIMSLNYQGEGIRDLPAYVNTSGTTTKPLYPAFHAMFPEKLILASESSSALSTRGTYLFPVTNWTSSPVRDTIGMGGNSTSQQVSAYELYSADFGSSPDISFASLDENPYVSGEFVWSGFDYIGEPTPYYTARSSYSGIIDLAGFPKDRYYLYQSRWRPDLKMAHILPHWNWPDRVGLVTPVHVFSAADEAELFLNGVSQGRIRKGTYEYRFRWNDVRYQPGELLVVTYKNEEVWANETMRTTSPAAQLQLTADRGTIKADGYDLSYITLKVVDSNGKVVPQAENAISFSVSGPGEIVATDNGDPADLTAFLSKERNANSGLALAIVRGEVGASGLITVTATANGLSDALITVKTQ